MGYLRAFERARISESQRMTRAGEKWPAVTAERTCMDEPGSRTTSNLISHDTEDETLHFET